MEVPNADDELREVVARADPEGGNAPLPALAQSLCGRLGCAVLAMRYPVEDDFAINLSADLYDGLLAHDQPLTRALQRALGRAWKHQDGTTSALSLATPALFGRAALDLVLSPPPGEPTRFDATGMDMVGFPPEPETFVGRVGPLARAGSALAPKSDFKGVLFHGMAGAGKTACALELAYRHRGRRFEGAAWYSAPREEGNVDALTRFASALQTQVDGFEIGHVIDDLEKLEAFLPRVRRLLSDRSLLIVLDNMESQLTPEGKWRDPRWELLVESLIGHDGLSRLVLTSRNPPASLLSDSRVLVESIHSLSPTESVLLARQLPNLGSLMLEGASGDLATGRKLVRRALQVVQGNPKLIELADAQAADPEALAARIEDAGRAWADRADLDAFFASGTPDEGIDADDFLRVIQSWATAIAANLPAAERLAFETLCCLEDPDRNNLMLEALWPTLWEQRIGETEAADLDAALSNVARQGLVDVEAEDGVRQVRIHPAVENTAMRSIDPDLRELVDQGGSAVWMALSRRATAENDTQMIVRTCLGAAPYLLRQDQPERTALVLSFAVTRDRSIPTLAAAIPLLERAAHLAKGTDSELVTRGVLARARAFHNSGDPIPELRMLRELAEQKGDAGRTVTILVDLFDALMRMGDLTEAENVLEELPAFRDEAESGPWSRMGHEVMRLRLMQAKGLNEKVLEEIPALEGKCDELGHDQDPDVATEWNVRESLFGIGSVAALNLEQWDQALAFNKKIHESEVGREAPALKQASTAFSAFGPLLELNRLPEAEAVLIQLRQTLESAGDLRRMGEVFGSWAILETRREHYDDALAFEYKALRHNYRQGEPGALVVNHHNIAISIFKTEGDPEEMVAHRFAAALIAYQTQSGEYPNKLTSLAYGLLQAGMDAAPESFAELCERLDVIDGCEFSALFARLPAAGGSGDDVFAAVCKHLEEAMPSD